MDNILILPKRIWTQHGWELITIAIAIEPLQLRPTPPQKIKF
jgi:hypothetical protein